jgi:hypothetical protein
MTARAPIVTNASPDPWRRMCAAHEMAHYVAFKRAAIEVTRPRVWRNGEEVTGCVRSGQPTFSCSIEELTTYLTCVMAGPVAGDKWSAQPGEVPCPSWKSEVDTEHVARDIRLAKASNELSVPAIHRLAVRLVDSIWDEIVAGVPHLSRTGRL